MSRSTVLESENAELSKELELSRSAKAAYQSEKDSREKAQELIQIQNADIQKLEMDIEQLNNIIKANKNEMLSTQSELHDTQRALDAAQKDLVQFKISNKALTERTSKAEAELGEAKTTIAKKDGEIYGLNAAIDQLREECIYERNRCVQ